MSTIYNMECQSKLLEENFQKILINVYIYKKKH